MSDEVTQEEVEVNPHLASRYEIEQLKGEIQRATGRRYDLPYEAMTKKQVAEMRRLMRDLEEEAQNKIKSRMRQQPWRYMGS